MHKDGCVLLYKKVFFVCCNFNKKVSEKKEGTDYIITCGTVS